ncbi:hypothetical protein PF010_g993 [Phytophthora fragariae]|uniref:Uncharacterized protein n=1 Tax=Phytophthora fragariae TaxID=53985 RepID=A0A6A3LU22_9STRA|nr:hypothetical protein PF011_g4801 [Phytophthora fragariae]KAE9138334.1 hypothetical protein PF010_g993 [Phytophthora fragariae]
MRERPELFHARFVITKRRALGHQDTSWTLHVKTYSGG